MKVIYKYEIKAGSNEFELPSDAKPLTVQMQDNKPYMWVLLDPESPKVKRYFFTIGTGHIIDNIMLKEYDRNINSLGDYIGTFQLTDFALVFHLFEIIK